MKCKIFMDVPAKAATLFNEYMKDKVLSSDVIIHTVMVWQYSAKQQDNLCIVVIHPNWWDKEKALTVKGIEKQGNQERS